jgi:hypothetical protein
MDLRQAADNTLSCQLERVPKPRRAERRQRRSEPRCAHVHGRTGSAAGHSRTNGRQGSALTAKTGSVGAEPTPSRFPADRRSDQDVVGSHLVPTFFSLRLRVAQHFT